MSKSFSNVKFFSALVVDGASFAISRRGYAAMSQGVAKSGGNISSSSNVIPKKRAEESSWMPDPKTGYFKPENQLEEIDPAELRQKLSKQKS